MNEFIDVAGFHASGFEPVVLPIERFVQDRGKTLTVDVRSPAEFQKGHIPGAVNVPLFDDHERESIGTTYRLRGQPAAILEGLEIAGPKTQSLVESVTSQLPTGGDGPETVQIYCWRGGLRSRSLAWLFEQVDLKPRVLLGGYKSFRQHVLDSFKKPLLLCVLSGLTGSGKTIILRQMKTQGQQVIDLEKLANHRGSTFGAIGLGDQPTVEHFENMLFDELNRLNLESPIWIEDESRKIGSATIPNDLFRQLRVAPAIFLDVDQETRVANLLQEYGEFRTEEFVDAIVRITKRLGGQNVQAALAALEQNDMEKCIDLILPYYDKTYLNGKSKIEREIFYHLKIDRLDAAAAAHLVSSSIVHLKRASNACS